MRQLGTQGRALQAVHRDRMGSYAREGKSGGMTFFRIPLHAADGTVRAYTLVDGEDLDWVLAHRWCLCNGYVVRSCRLGPGRWVRIRLHREILGVPRASRVVEVDHLSGDPLDNRRANLRVTDRRGNAQNLRSFPNTSSRFRGVSWDKEKRKWVAQAKMAGRNYHLGRFSSEEEAASAAAAWRAAHMPGSIEALRRAA